MWIRDSHARVRAEEDRHSLTSLWPHLPSPSSFHIPLGNWLLWRQIPKTNGIFGSLHWPFHPFRQALSSAPHLSSAVSAKVTLFANLPKCSVKRIPPQPLASLYPLSFSSFHLSHLRDICLMICIYIVSPQMTCGDFFVSQYTLLLALNTSICVYCQNILNRLIAEELWLPRQNCEEIESLNQQIRKV